MKYFLTAAFLFMSAFGFAQIVNIPDAEFKLQLLDQIPAIDTNGDGEIQESEAQAVTKLEMTANYTVHDMTGIKSFTNLDTLNAMYFMSVTSMDLSGMNSLKCVILDLAKIHSIDVSNCSNLEQLMIENSSVYDSISNINLTGTRKIKMLWVNSSFNLPGLDLRACDSLETFLMGAGNIQGVLDFSGLEKLTKISFEGYIGTINATNATALKQIAGLAVYSEDAHINEMVLTNCINLESIGVGFFYGAYIDVSSCPKLAVLVCNCRNLRHLNLKNGTSFVNTNQLGIYVLDNPSPLPLYVCTDDAETSDVLNAIATQNPGLTITANSFCTPGLGGTYNTITGKLRYDENTNGCDPADAGIANIPFRISDGTNNTIKYTNASGNYRHEDYVGNFTVTPYFPYPYFSISPAAANVAYATASNFIDTFNFCVTPTGSYNQVEVTMLPYGVGRARPGFIANYEVLFRNRGTNTLNGNVEVNFDHLKTSYYLASVAPSLQSPGYLSWNYNNLLPFESRSIIVSFNVLPPPVNNIGDTLVYLALVNPVAGDATPADNNFILPQKTVGSWDPNDKICIEGDKLNIDKIGDKLHYIIHFQNMGTDTAFNVVVTDTLANNIDWESFDFISSSHPCNVKRVNNKLEFYFQNIHLPYQAIDEPGSNGFVAFAVKPKSSLVIGDSVNNTASIYFDFNPPVVTNTTTSVVSTFAAVPLKLEYFSLSGKAEGNTLTWKVATSDGPIRFDVERSNDGLHFNNLGNITATSERCQVPFNFTDTKPLPGKNFYRIKITDANQNSFYSKILVTGSEKSGFDVLAISGDQNNTLLYLNVASDQNLQMKIVASDGRIVYTQSKTITAGTNQLNLQTGNLSKGVYTLIVYTNTGELITKRFIK